MTADRRQRLLLAVLGAVLLLFLATRLPGWIENLLPSAAPPPAAPAGRAAVTGPEVVAVRLGDLEVSPFAFVVGRDPFRFGPLPAPPPPPPPTAAELAALERARLEAEERARLAALEAAKPRPPTLDLVYLGSFGPPEKRFAVLSRSGRQEVLNALAGEVIDGKFVLEEIGYESILVKFVGFPEVPAARVAVGR